MSRPTVSVILPTYNRENLLPRAVESVIAQSFDDWEIVLVDDGSTDGTPALARRYAERLHDRFTIIRQPNGGSSSARNRGIDACRGRFVAFLDSDDEFLPTKLERHLELFNRRPELGFVYSDYAFVDLGGTRHDSAFDTINAKARRIRHEAIARGLCVCTSDLFDALIRAYFIATIAGMVRREVLSHSIRFPVDQAYAEEWLFYLRVAKACRAGFVDEPLCLHHHTVGSLARTDPHRNTLGYRSLLSAIAEEFDDLTWAQRRAVRTNRAQAGRQLGYEAYRAADYGQALRYFAESFGYEPGLRTLFNLSEATAQWALVRLARLGRRGVTGGRPGLGR